MKQTECGFRMRLLCELFRSLIFSLAFKETPWYVFPLYSLQYGS